MLAAREAAPHLAGLADDLLPRLPRKPLASQNLRSICRNPFSSPTLLDDAILYPWVALNTQQGINALLFDIDHADGLELVQSLPAHIRPTLVMDPWSGRSAGILPLKTSVLTTEGARPGPRILADLAHRLMAAALQATALPHVSLVKSPWGLAQNLLGLRIRRGPTPAVPMMWEAYQASGSPLMWHTVPGAPAVELRDVVAALADTYGDIATRPAKLWAKRRGEPDNRGRNCALFDLVRWWAYDRQEKDGGAILAEATRVNARFPEPLPASEVAATARSITRFMNSHFNPRSDLESRRGVMGLAGSGLDMDERQRRSARRTHAIRTGSTDARIQAALQAWPAGELLTQAALAQASGVSERTIRARWKTLQVGSLKTGNMVSYQVVPGQPAPGPQAQPQVQSASLSLKEQAKAVRQKAQAQRRAAQAEERAAARFQALAARMAQKGARPVMVPAPAPGTSPAVRQAWSLAVQSRKDAQRRAAARKAKVELESKKARVAAWAQQGARGKARYTALLAAMGEHWDAAESTLTGADRLVQERMRMARSSAFRAIQHAWSTGMQADQAAIPY